jgi:uncharacterized FlgJ-related protein
MKNTYFKLTDDLKLKRVSNLGIVAKFSLLLNFVFVIIICVLIAKEPSIRKIHTHTTDTITIGDVSMTDSSILKELVKHKCVLPSIAIAQARIESGNYKSQVCKQNKNLFGIKWHKCEFVAGEHLNHASYKSYKDNIRCYIHIQNRYLRNIDGRYAAAGGYVTILKGMTKHESGN